MTESVREKSEIRRVGTKEVRRETEKQNVETHDDLMNA